MDKRDRQFDENLRALGRHLPRPADARPEQVARWRRLAQDSARSKTLRFVAAWNRPVVRRWMYSAAVAAVLVLGIFIAFYATPKSVSADDVFAQIDHSLAAQQVVHLDVQNLILRNHRLHLQFFGGRGGRAVFAEVNVQPTDAADPNAIWVDLALGRNDEEGWIHVSRLQMEDRYPLGNLIPAQGSLLIDVPISTDTGRAVETMFPLAIRLSDIRSLIVSLRQAVPSLDIRTLPDGTVQLEGVITRPEDLDLQMLREITNAMEVAATIIPHFLADMSEQELRVLRAEIRRNLADRMSEEEIQNVNQQLDLILAVAMRQLASRPVQKPDGRRRTHAESLLRTLLTGATLKIAYDPQRELLRRVMVENIGTSNGSLHLRLDEPGFDLRRTKPPRAQDDPGLCRMSRDEVIQALLLSLVVPKAAPVN